MIYRAMETLRSTIWLTKWQKIGTRQDITEDVPHWPGLNIFMI